MNRFWNFVHYYAYISDYKLHLLFNRINPILYLYKLPFAKKHFEKMKIDPVIELNRTFQRPDIGISSIRSSGLMYILVFLLCCGLGNLYIGVYRIKFHVSIYPFILAIAISLIVNYYLLFRHKKYLHYFKEFEKMESSDKKRWSLLSLGVILGIMIFAIGSFLFMIYRF